MSNAYATSYDQAPPPSVTTKGSRFCGIPVDRRYTRGWLGVLKLVESILCLVGFICVTTSAYVCAPWVGTAPYYCFITMFCCITALLHYFLMLCMLQQRIFTCSCCFWPLIELIYYGGVLVLLFFGCLFLSLHACTAQHQAGVAFGWFAFFGFCIDTGLAARTFVNSSRSPHLETATATTTTDARY